MTLLTRVAIGMAVAAMAAAAPAQLTGLDGERFISLVRDGENAEAVELLKSKPVVANAVDSRGETALLVALKKRDAPWIAHLLSSGADPNFAARNGDTPLIVATRAGTEQSAAWLLEAGAKVDGANKMGETALIVAVQNRNQRLVELLLAAGADPDRTDSAAGYSARDYAKRENRFPNLLAAIEASKRARPAAAKPASDNLDDFKLKN